jgi:APA family basic amino acid/polyamine antiporter
MEQHRQLGLAATIAVVTGESIALGIFLTPAAMAKSLGSPLLLTAVWCGMGLIAMCGALCYSELAVRFPRAGGEYVYLREGYGSRVAFLYGWMSAAVMDPGLAAALAMGATPYVLSLLGVSPQVRLWIPAVILVGLALLNYAGTRLSRRVMSVANLLPDLRHLVSSYSQSLFTPSGRLTLGAYSSSHSALHPEVLLRRLRVPAPYLHGAACRRSIPVCPADP